jgi:hypothetical protein
MTKIENPNLGTSPLRLLVEPETSAPEPDRPPTMAEALAAYRSVWTSRVLKGEPVRLRLVTYEDPK